MNYKEIDWSGFNDIPSEAVYDEWQKARIGKHNCEFNQSAINLIKPHINKLFNEGVSADMACSMASAQSWRSLKYAWVMRELEKDERDYFDVNDSYSNQPIGIESHNTHEWAHAILPKQ